MVGRIQRRRIILQNFSTSRLAVSEELGNEQTNRQTDSLTSFCFKRLVDLRILEESEPKIYFYLKSAAL